MASPVPFFNEVEWRAPGLDPIPPGHWPRNEFLPRVGETRWTFSIFPTAVQVGTRVWFLFEPLAAVFNGLSHEPTHMDEAAIVEVEILERRVHGPVIYQNASSPSDRDCSWLQVRCLQVVMLCDIADQFEETAPLTDFYRSPTKGAESNKIVELLAGQEGYSDAYYLTKTMPPRAVIRIFDCVSGESERVILNSALELPDLG